VIDASGLPNDSGLNGPRLLHPTTTVINSLHNIESVATEGVDDPLGTSCDSESSKRRVFTIGYEGLSEAEFLGVLVTERICKLVDVRDVAFSRKPGFSKTPLSKMLESSGISYTHLECLGSPKKTRSEYRRTSDFRAFSRAYLEHLALQSESMSKLVSIASRMPTAIMCFERDPGKCHRSLIASRMRSMGFEVKDL